MTIRHDGMKATDWSTALSSMRLEPTSGVLFSDAGNGRRFLFFFCVACLHTCTTQFTKGRRESQRNASHWSVSTNLIRHALTRCCRSFRRGKISPPSLFVVEIIRSRSLKKKRTYRVRLFEPVTLIIARWVRAVIFRDEIVEFPVLDLVFKLGDLTIDVQRAQIMIEV